MLFSGEEALKKVNVLSGGERVRCMLSKMMLSNANVLIFDQPTTWISNPLRHLILNDYRSNILFTAHDHELVQTLANRIIEVTPNKMSDYLMTYDEYLEIK
jgi:ATPase subunit of ABC transporter with duplicated ATPase domains